VRGKRLVAPLAFAGSAGLIGYTFLGYPALIALLARTRPRPVLADGSFRPTASLIILAHNEQDVIEQKLANTLELDYPADLLEVIVVSDGSDDETPLRAAAFERVRLLHQPGRRGKLAAMLRGAAAATGEVLVFSDANNLYSHDALVELMAPFSDACVGVVSGRKVIENTRGRALDHTEGVYWRYESKLKQWESESGSVAAAVGEILAFRREAFPSIESDSLVEDLVQVMSAAAAGWRVVYAAGAVSTEAASATIEDEATRRTRLVAGRWQVIGRLLPRLALRQPGLAWRLFSHKLTRPLIPSALVILAASNATLARRSHWARLVAGGQLGFYAAAIAGWRAERIGKRSRATYLAYYFCRMNLATLNAPISLLRRRQQAAWVRVKRD
jgi:poly-beta-1,6-N-acetyl-D-glucosamine synthase